jgi:glycosyltransferase involved in cell wall biosynthesis
MESVLAARLAGVPKVLATYHTDSAYDVLDGRLTAGYRALERATNRLLDRAIAVSGVTRSDRVRIAGIPGSRVVTIHNGIDPDRFARLPARAAARAELGLPADRVLIGGVGQLARYKGYDVLIRAFAGVAGRCPQADLVIAGTGPLREELEALADRLGARGRIHFLGFQPDVLRVLAALDIYVLASICEALPYALLEAMAAGLPVLATAVGGVPEVIEPGVSGLLVAPGRVDAMADALGRLADSAPARARLGAAARERVGRHFHQRDSARRTIAVYRQLLNLPR